MHALLAELWVWYGVTWFVVFMRIISRRILLGSFKSFQLDDILMLVAMITDTMIRVGTTIVVKKGSNLFDPYNPPPLTPEDIQNRIIGAKWTMVVETMQCATLWLAKSCLLILFYRITRNLGINMVIKVIAVYVVASFWITEIIYFTAWCRPFHDYWAVPAYNTQCSVCTNYMIVNAVFDISTDLSLILIPLPLFLRTSFSWGKKLLLCGVFTLGTFTIICAILSKYYTFQNRFGVEWPYWYIRESSTSLIVVNLPMTGALFRFVFGLGSFKKSSYNTRTRSSPVPHGEGVQLSNNGDLTSGQNSSPP